MISSLESVFNLRGEEGRRKILAGEEGELGIEEGEEETIEGME